MGIVGAIAYGQKMVVPHEWFEGIISTRYGSLQLMPIREYALNTNKERLNHKCTIGGSLKQNSKPNKQTKNETKLVLLFKSICKDNAEKLMTIFQMTKSELCMAYRKRLSIDFHSTKEDAKEREKSTEIIHTGYEMNY